MHIYYIIPGFTEIYLNFIYIHIIYVEGPGVLGTFLTIYEFSLPGLIGDYDLSWPFFDQSMNVKDNIAEAYFDVVGVQEIPPIPRRVFSGNF